MHEHPSTVPGMLTIRMTSPRVRGPLEVPVWPTRQNTGEITGDSTFLAVTAC